MNRMSISNIKSIKNDDAFSGIVVFSYMGGRADGQCASRYSIHARCRSI